METKLKIGNSFFETTQRPSPYKSSFLLIIFLLSFPLTSNSQSRWSNYIGVYFTGNAEMYYTGPSILIGSDFHLKKNISAAFYGHYFNKNFGDHGFQTWTIATLGQINLGKKKKFYMAIGIALQRALEEDILYPDDVINRTIIVPAYRIGYHLFFRKIILSPEINTTGPYSYNNNTSFELFTLPSIGVRLHFIKIQNRI